MDMQEAAFTVTLCDYPNLPEQERNKAEARYARVLERQLGSAEQVAKPCRSYRGWRTCLQRKSAKTPSSPSPAG